MLAVVFGVQVGRVVSQDSPMPGDASGLMTVLWGVSIGCETDPGKKMSEPVSAVYLSCPTTVASNSILWENLPD